MYANSNQSQYLLRRFAEEVAPRVLLPPTDNLGHRNIATGCTIYLPFPFESNEFANAIQAADIAPPTITPPGDDIPPIGSSSGSWSRSTTPSVSADGSSSSSSESSVSSSSGSGGGGSTSDGGSGSGSGTDGGSGSGSVGPITYDCADAGPQSCCTTIEILGDGFSIDACSFYPNCPPGVEEIPLCCCAREFCPDPTEPCPGGPGTFVLTDYFCCYADGELRIIQDNPDPFCPCNDFPDEA